MCITLGINSPTSLSVLVTTASAGAGSAMAGKPIDMTRTDAGKKTYSAGEDTGGSSSSDGSISVSGSSTPWFSDSTVYTGSFTVHVFTTESGSSGDGYTPTVTVTKTGDATVTVTTPRVVYSEAMIVAPFEVSDVAVFKDGDSYYLSKGTFSTTTSDGAYAITGSSLTAKLADGILTLEVIFQPGAMPFAITELFVSAQAADTDSN